MCNDRGEDWSNVNSGNAILRRFEGKFSSAGLNLTALGIYVLKHPKTLRTTPKLIQEDENR